MRKISTISLILALAGLAMGLGCGKEEPPAPTDPMAVMMPGGMMPPGMMPAMAETTDQITVCLLPKKKGLPFFTSCAKGAREAAAELGNVEVIYDGPTDGAAEKSASFIDRWALKGVDVIAVSPNDPDVLAPSMRAARAKGVKVITWDADAAEDTREFFVNQATAQDIGYALVDALASDIVGPDGDPKAATGQVAIITATLTAANQNTWIGFMKDRLPEYPGLELIATKPSEENQSLAKSVAEDLMKAYPDLKGLFAISSVAFPGAAEAVRQAGKGGVVQVVGLSTPNNMREYVKDGTVKSVILWNTEDLGYLTIQVARAIHDGTLKRGDTTFSAGRLGDRKVAGDNVLLGEILVFTEENIDNFDF